MYKQAYELTHNMPREQKCTITLHFDAACDKRHYNASDASIKEIAVLLPGDRDEVKSPQDIIIQCLKKPIKCFVLFDCLRDISRHREGESM